MAWYKIQHEEKIDTPALLVYPERVKDNILLVKRLVSMPASLRPHVKTHKIKEVAELMLAEGITKFKCATIAEAEMLAMAGARDVLLAYQPSRPKAKRLAALRQAYPHIHFSCLIDNLTTAQLLSAIFIDQHLSVYIDLNVGMNRTGILPEQAASLFSACQQYPHISIIGLHAYDGHIHDQELLLRKQKADEVYKRVMQAKESIESITDRQLTLVLGGTPTFSIYAQHTQVEVSPGTFIFWDEGYQQLLPDLPFHFAAAIMTRIISLVDDHKLCLDLGYKSVAAEKPLPRVKFLNVEGAVPIAQSEEHLVVQVPDATKFHIGDVWYAIPYHICPTVALYEAAHIIYTDKPMEKWKVVARDRTITF